MKKNNTYLYEMDILYLNIIVIIFTLLLVPFTFWIMDLKGIDLVLSNFDIILLLILLIPYFILHEILHSIGYVIHGASFKNITFGMHLEKSILCCSCKQSINKKTILCSLLYPFIFIGIITFIIGIIFNLPILIILSIANISGCVGDLVMFLAFIKIKDFKFFEYDNPLAFGIITNENLEKRKFIGLRLIKEEKITQTVNKKITISKASIIILIMYSILILVDIFCCI